MPAIIVRAVGLALILALPTAWPATAQCPDGTPPPCRGVPARAAAPAMSVAVLDFENLSRDTGDTYLSQGLAEELTSQIGQVRRLVVASRAAVRRLHNAAAMPLPEVGRTLNVSYLVNGSVRRSGTRLRVTVELLRAATGAQVWSSQYDRSEDDLLAIQEAVSTAVTTAVAGRLLPIERATLTARPTRSAAAYDAYLRGRVKSDRLGTRQELLDAVALFERATAIDTSFAFGWASLSLVQTRMFWFYIDRSAERLARARTAADRAAALAPDAPEPHIALGYYYYWGSRDYGRALQEFSAALVARPNDAEVHSAIANVARRQGSWQESLASRTRALELDPGSRSDAFERGLTLSVLRRFDEADVDYERSLVPPAEMFTHIFMAALALARDGALDRARSHVEFIAAHPEDFAEQTYHDPGATLPVWRSAGPHQAAILAAHPAPTAEARALHYLVVAQVLLAQGRREDAAAASDSVRAIVQDLLHSRPDDDGFHAQLAQAYLGLGRCDDAIREAERSTTLLPVSADALSGPQRLQNFAEIEAACGRPEQALDHLSYLLSIPSLVTRALLRADPAYAPLRSIPRFEQLVAGR